MKKKFSILLALVLAFTMCASIMTAYAADPVVYEFTKEGIACVGDKATGDAKFFGKSKRFDYAYENGVSKLIFTDGDNGTKNPYIVNSAANIDGNVYKYVKIAYWSQAASTMANFYFLPAGGSYTDNFVSSAITCDGTWQYATFDMTTKPTWTGNIAEIRYDFLCGDQLKKDDFVYCGYIALFDTKEAADAYSVTLPDPTGATDPVDPTAPSFTLDKAKYEIKDGDFSIKVDFKNAPAADTWFGIYPADVADTITEKESLGVWLYTNGSKTAPEAVTADGSVTFTKAAIDAGKELKAGDYKLIMFKGGSAEDTYTVVASKAFTLADASNPVDPPKTGDTGIILTLAAVAVVLSAAVVCFKKRTEA